MIPPPKINAQTRLLRNTAGGAIHYTIIDSFQILEMDITAKLALGNSNF